ncbi:hypothetical protein PoB_000549400 [Plakobranchus ocellatus]|uniref:Uncharacterized protein n=1 Tax=Plakobranchus ocellatus TaxID=259542 RepID=A0AAV3Y7U3_9GAST|nr:hypothetical protein PoB_000549400 [Plakobranchus ocellatus]
MKVHLIDDAEAGEFVNLILNLGNANHLLEVGISRRSLRCGVEIVDGKLLDYIHAVTCHLSHRSGIRRGAAEDLLTTAFHSSLSSAFRKVFLSSSPVHSLMLSSQRFFCLPPSASIYSTLHDGLRKAR